MGNIIEGMRSLINIGKMLGVFLIMVCDCINFGIWYLFEILCKFMGNFIGFDNILIEVLFYDLLICEFRSWKSSGDFIC